HSTFDRRGDQFVVRKEDPPAPPDASRLPLWYVRGGGMLLRGSLAKDEKATFLVDSSQPYFIALSDPLWKMSGVDAKAIQADPTRPDVRGAQLPLMRLAGFELPQVPALSSAALNNAQAGVDVDLGGVIGASLISAFRVTFGDEGRFIWMEPDMTQQAQLPPPQPPQTNNTSSMSLTPPTLQVPSGMPSGLPAPATSTTAPPKGTPAPKGTPKK
ncbi:MAG: hypothetical protein ACRELY_12745, partial [Polyangiaceae bacterium]